MTRWRRPLLGLCLLLAACPRVALARGGTPALGERLALLMENRCDALGVPGMAMTVVQHGHVLYEGGYGYADPSSSLKAAPGTTFRIPSLSPALTALALLRLQDERHLFVINPVGFYLDEVAGPQAGFAVSELIERASRGTGSGDRASALGRAAGATTGNADEALLQRVVAQASGRSYRDYLRDEFFAPMAMAHTGASDELAAAGVVIARMYAQAPRGHRWVQALPDVARPAPGEPTEFASTVGDLHLLAQGLLERDFIGAGAYRRLGFEHPAGDQGWSLGWHSETAADMGGLTLVSTSGEDASDAAAIWLLPERDGFVVTLANISVPGVSDVGRAAARLVFAGPQSSLMTISGKPAAGFAP